MTIFNVFKNEAKLTSTISHPNVVRTLSFGMSAAGQAYLVLEYLDGHSLLHELDQHKRLTLGEFRDIFIPVLSALEAAHSAGVVHRDIKPSNIMLCRADPGAATVKVVDFGIAKVSQDKGSQGLTKTSQLICLRSHFHPE